MHIFEKSPNKTNSSVCVCTFEKSLCEDIHWPGAVHTHHLLQSIAPARVWCPMGKNIFSLMVHITSLFFAVLVFSCSPGNCSKSWAKIKERLRDKWGISFFNLWWAEETNQLERKTLHELTSWGKLLPLHVQIYGSFTWLLPHLRLSSLLHSHQPVELPCILHLALHRTWNTKVEQYTRSLRS